MGSSPNFGHVVPGVGPRDHFKFGIESPMLRAGHVAFGVLGDLGV